MGFKIVSLGISVTYQILKISKCLFILNCLLVQLFCALHRMNDVSKSQGLDDNN